jgi:hypothetical protein
MRLTCIQAFHYYERLTRVSQLSDSSISGPKNGRDSTFEAQRGLHILYSTPCVLYISVGLKRMCMTVKCAMYIGHFTTTRGSILRNREFPFAWKELQKFVCEFTTVVSMTLCEIYALKYIYSDKSSQISFTFWKWLSFIEYAMQTHTKDCGISHQSPCSKYPRWGKNQVTCSRKEWGWEWAR